MMKKFFLIACFLFTSLYGGQELPSDPLRASHMYVMPELFIVDVESYGARVGYRSKKGMHGWDVALHMHRNALIPSATYLLYPFEKGFFVGAGVFTILPTLTYGAEIAITERVALMGQMSIIFPFGGSVSLGVGF